MFCISGLLRVPLTGDGLEDRPTEHPSSKVIYGLHLT